LDIEHAEMVALTIFVVKHIVPIHHCLKISTQMRPTPLVPSLGQVAVYTVPIAGKHAPVVGAHQCSQGSAIAAADDSVHRGYCCNHHPQPTPATH
jgi:hypothetical protein